MEISVIGQKLSLVIIRPFLFLIFLFSNLYFKFRNKSVFLIDFKNKLFQKTKYSNAQATDTKPQSPTIMVFSNFRESGTLKTPKKVAELGVPN